MNAGNSHRHGATLLARMLVAITFVFGMASVQAEIFNESPARMIGPANDVPIGASIGGQGGWAVSCSPTKYDEEISHDRARAGMQSWRVSNWFHEGCVNSVLSPAFASVAEGSSPNNSIVNSFWFNVPAGNAGLTISASLGDAPGQRLTYAAIIDDGATLRVQAVGILNGSGFAGPPLPAPFDDPGVEYQIANSSPLAHDTWYQLRVSAQLVSGARDDTVLYEVLDDVGTVVWASGSMASWEDAYLAGPFAPPGTKVTVTRLGFRIIENPDHLNNRLPYGYATNRPAGVYIDDLSVLPGGGMPFHVGFEADRYVGPAGTDTGTCGNPLSRCATIGYAVSQADVYSTIHVAPGIYDESVTITEDGLRLIGDGPGPKPVLTRTAGGTNQPLLVVNGAEDVRIENLDFGMDESYVAEGILASGFVDGLAIVDNHFGSSKSLPATSSTFRYRNAISINYINNSLGLPRVDGSTVLVDGNVVDGINVPAGSALRSGISMDAGLGTLGNNTITANTHDIVVRFATVTGASTSSSVSITGNTLQGRGLEFSSPNASVSQVTIDSNIISALPGIDDTTSYAADWSLMRLMHNPQSIPMAIDNNQFLGHQGSYRGVLIENYPGIVLTGNVFTPAAGAADFVSLVVSNKEITSDNPPAAPLSMALTALGNTFNGSGTAGAGTAVEFLNDNDAGGSAAFGSLLFGNAGQENQFDANLRWYFHLDDFNCDTVATPCTFLDYAGVGTIPNTEVRPFDGDVSAQNNLFDGVAPASMDAAQQFDLLAHTFDSAANAALGTVDYGVTAATELQAFVDDGFAGASYGDALSFTHGATSPGTVYFGINAFATIADGVMNVVDGGQVYVAKGTYPAGVTIGHEVQVIGDGNGPTDTVVTAAITIAASGSAPASPLLLQDLRVSNATGSAVQFSGNSQYLEFSGVHFTGNSDAAVNFTGQVDHVLFDTVTFDANTSMGIRTSTTARVSDVQIIDSVFSNNDRGGIILFGADNSGDGVIQDWSIDNTQFVGNDNADATAFGGGIWIKTGGAGSVIDGFTVTNSFFDDNGSTNSLNQVGITIRARPGTTMQNVSICNNMFSDTIDPGTQLTGINVFDDTGNTGYEPIEICASNTFNGLAHSVSGLEQFTLRGTQPIVDITGGTIADTEHINGFVVRVRDGATFPTIGAAMNDAGTTDGDEIHAPAGLYHENVAVTHDDMILSGDGPSTIIDGTGLSGSGISLPNGRTGTTIVNLSVRNFAAIGTSEGACIHGALGNDGTVISGTTISNCQGGRGGVYLNGSVDDVTIVGNDVSNVDGRGIVIWNGFKTDIVISQNHVHDMTGCCGIELQDGTASGVTITDNVVENVGDSGMAFVGLTSGAGPNVITGNTVTNTGRFGIEIKMPDGTGASSGDGAIIVANNTVTRPPAPSSTDVRDVAGIAVIRRPDCTTCAYNDIPTGVVVTDNVVSGWTQASANDGFGIVAEGLEMHVFGNDVSGSDVGIQLQAGNDGYPGLSDQAATNDYFSRGNSPTSCIDLGANNFSGNGIDSRNITAPAGGDLSGRVQNTTQGTYFCTIQAAIDAPSTLAGDTISVEQGTFDENIVVTKGVTLQGPFHGTAGHDGSRSGAGEAVISPASGIALKVNADSVVFDGFTIADVSDTAIASGGNYGGGSTNVQILNNRILDVHAGSGLYTNGPPPTVFNWTVQANLVRNVESAIGSGINLWAVDGGVISDNHVEDSAFGGIQTVYSANVTISDNVIDDTAHNGINVANAQTVAVEGNTITDANTSATPDEAGLTLYGGTSNVTVSCNSVSGAGSNGFSTASAIVTPFSNIRVFHNALTVASSVSHNLAQGIDVGSNWYGGGAPSIGGTNAGGVQVADALAATPIGNLLCGDNTPATITAVSGTPQSATVNAPFAQPLVARVTDALGGAVAGDSVAFTAPGAGASAILSPASASTDFNGYVSTAATANSFAGSYTVSAADGIAPDASFALTNDAGTGAFLDLNGPVANVQQGVPTLYTGRIFNTGAALSENALVHVVIASNRAGGIQAGDVVAEYDLGAGWQPLPLAFVGGALVVDYGPPGGFPIPFPYDVTTNFRFTFNHADSPQTTYMATASLVGVGGTVYSTDMLATEVVPADTSIALSLNGPLAAPVNTPTPYSARLTNTGSPAPENVVVHFTIGRDGGIDPGDFAIAYFDGSSYQPIGLVACGSQMCGTFGPGSGFPVPNGYDATTPLQVTYARSGTYSVNATVDGVSLPATTYAAASLAVNAGVAAQVDLDGPSAGVEIGEAAIYTVRLDNPSGDALSQPAAFTLEVTDVPGPIVAGDLFSLEFDDGLGAGYQTVTAQVAPGPNGGLEYVFDNAGAGYAIGAMSTFVGHVRVHFATAVTYQLRLAADGLGSPAESYGSDQVDTTVIVPTTDVEFTVTGPVSGVEVGNDTVYVGHLRNHGATLPEQVHSQFCLTRDGNPVASGDLVGEIAFSGSGGTFTAPLILDALGCAQLGDETLTGGWDQTATFTLNFAEPGAYVMMGELVGATSGTIYAALNQSTLVTLPTGGRTLSLDGPLSGVGVGEDVAYLGGYHNGGSAIPGNQEFILCVTRDGVAAANTDVGIAWDTDGSGSYANTLTLDGAGCAQVDADFASTAGFDFDAELRYTHAHVGTYVSTATVRSVANPATVYASDTATTVVDQGQAIVSLSNLAQAYDGTPKSATVNTVPGGLTVDVTYDGSATPPTAAGSYAVVATVNDVDWTGSASGTLVISDSAGISLALVGPGVAGSGSYVPGFAATINNTGGVTAQAVHYRATVVRIDDGNFDPISASDVDACVGIGDGFAGDCSAGYFSLQVGKTSGSHDGRPAVFFRYPNLPANDLPLPNTGGPQAIPFEIRFAPGQYRLLTEVVGADDTTIYATSSTIVTTVPDAAITLDGSFTGSAEQSLLSTTTLTNFGGPLPENVLVRLTLTDSSSAPLVATDAEFAYQDGATYQTLPWTEQGGALVTLFGPPVTGFPVGDGYNASTAGRGIFHRLGQYDLLVEVVDAATLTTVYASDTHAFTIDPLALAITLNDLTQTYDGSPRPVAVSSAPSVPPGTIDVVYTGSGATSYGPSASAPIDAGTYAVTADATGLYSGHATGSLVVNPANAVVTIDPLSLDWTFDGSPHAAVVTTSPPGLPVAVTYDGNPTPPTAVGSYIVVASVTDPNWQGSAIDVLTIDPSNATLDMAGDPVGAVTIASSAPLYSMSSSTTHLTGTPPAENVIAHILIGRSGGASPTDLSIDYLAATQESTSCVAAVPSGFWCPLPLVDNGDGTLGSTFGPGSGFPLTDGATSFFRTAYHAGGQYLVDVTIDGVTSGATYASASRSVEVAELELVASGPATATTGVEIDSSSTLANIGSAAIEAAAPAPNDENVVGEFQIALGAGALAPADLTVSYLAPDNAYHAIPLAPCVIDPNQLCGSFGPGAGFPVAAGYNATSLFRTLFTLDGTYTVTSRVVGVSSGSVFAESAQVIAVGASSATIAIDPASLAQTYNGGAHPVIVTTTPSGLAYTVTYDGSPTPPTNAGDYAVVATITQPGYSGVANATLQVAKAIGSVSFGPTNFTFDGAAHATTAVITEEPGNATACVLTPSGDYPRTNAGSTSIAAACDGTNYTANAGTTLVVSPLSVTINLAGTGSFVYDGAAHAATATVIGELPGFPATVDVAYTPGGASAPVDAGTYGVTASLAAGGNYAGAPVTDAIAITQAPATVTIDPADLDQDFGSTHAVGVTTLPAGLDVDVTYDGSTAVPTQPGSYAVVATIDELNYAGSATAILNVGDAADVSLTLDGPSMALIGASAPYTDHVDYTGTIANIGSPTAQNVHSVISVVRIDDGNTTGGAPIAIDPDDVLVCVYDPSGWAAQDPGNHHGCPQDYESLFLSQGTGSVNGRPAATFRYPNLAANDLPLPSIDPAIALPPSKFQFKHGEYQVHLSLVGDDGTVYATAMDGTTVPDAAISYSGPTSGQTEDALLSTSTLTNVGGRVDGNVIVRITLADAASAALTPADADVYYQDGGNFVPLPWTQDGNNLVTFFGPGSGFPLEDGHDATSSAQGIFHRDGVYDLTYEVVDIATGLVVFADQETQITIAPNMVNFDLSDLNQVYDGSPRAITVNPAAVPHTVVYEPQAGTCPAGPVGANTTPPTDAGSYCVYVEATGSYVGSASGVLVVAKAMAPVTIDGAVAGVVSRTFDGTPQVVTASTPVTLTGTIDVTYNGNATAPSAAGSYSLAATINDPNYEGGETGTLVIATVGGTSIVLDDDDGTPDGTIHRTFSGAPVAPVTATTTPAGVAYAVTYVGDGGTVYPLTATPPTAAGQYHVEATTTDPNYDVVTASGTLVVDVQAATIVLDAGTLGATYDGATHAVTATTTPAGLAYSVTYDGSTTPPVDAGSYAVVATITDPDYSGTASDTLVIAKAVGVVTFGPTNYTFDGTAHDTTAVISQEPANATACVLTASAGDYPRTDAGSTSLDAVCDGDNWTASASTTLVVSPKPVTIALAGTGTFVYDGTPHAATATVNGEVTGFPAATVVTYDGSSTAPVDVGNHAVLAVLDAGSTNYSASPANGTIAITPAAATVSLSDLVQTWDGGPHPVTVTTTPAGLAVAVTYDGSATPPTDVGTYAVSAIVTDPNHAGSATGTLQVLPGAADAIAANGAVTFTGIAGEPLAGPLPSVRVTDAGGNPVAGVTVTFAAGANSGSLSGAVQSTDGGGFATLGGWTLDAEPGANTVTASAAGVAGTVVFTATGEMPTGGISVDIDDSREYAQALHVLTYTITVSNNSGSNESAIGISDMLPPELDASTAQWQCVPVNGATCTAVGSGDVIDSVDLPAHSGVVYILTALVNGGMDDTIVNVVEVDTANGTITASDTTMIVIFRNGFEFGGDGAEDPDNKGPVVALGELSATGIVALDIDPNRVPRRVVTLAGTPDGSLRLDAIRVGDVVWLRLVARDAGIERASAWSELIAPGATLGLYNDATGNPRVLLIGTEVDLDMAVAGNSRFVLERRG